MAISWLFCYVLIIHCSTIVVAQNNLADCQNGGTKSHDATGHQFCQCPANYTGIKCETVNCEFCEAALFDVLFKQYNNQVRPAKKPVDVTIVMINFTIISLLDILEKDEQMEIIGFFELLWVDLRLTWHPDNFGGIETLVIPAGNVWLPDVLVSNSAVSFYEYSYKRDFFVSISNDGRVNWIFGGIILTTCDIDMEDYPFDNQTCSISVETWMYNRAQVDLDTTRIRIMDTVYENSMWDLTNYEGYKELTYGDGYSRITFTFNWRRKRLYYLMNIVLPAIVLVIITLGVYWLPPESGEKISLAVTILLAHSVFLIIIMDNTPENSTQIPLITIFVMLVMSVTALSLLVSIATAFLEGKANMHRAPKWLRIFCMKYAARIMCMKVPYFENDVIIMNTISKPPPVDNFIKRGTLHKLENSHLPNSANPEKTKQICKDSQLDDISRKLGQILGFLDEKKESDAIQDEWVIIGRVIDRFFFWISLILIIVLLPLIYIGII